jgi:hypothetical protein
MAIDVAQGVFLLQIEKLEEVVPYLNIKVVRNGGC